MYLQWDLLTKVGQVQPIVNIANGRDPSSRISLLCLHVSCNLLSSSTVLMFLLF